MIYCGFCSTGGWIHNPHISGGEAASGSLSQRQVRG